MNIGQKVKTNDYYLNCGYDWIKRNPLKLGTVTGIEKVDNDTIIHVKTVNGKKRSFNELFIEAV